MDDPKTIVKNGYDLVWKAQLNFYSDGDTQDREFVDELIALHPDGGRALDLGCATGPVTRLLAGHFAATGVDISPVQTEYARKHVPGAEFICADMSDVEFEDQAFSAIVCLYAIIHVPLEEHPAVLRKLYRWLRPGGHLVITTGSRAWTGTEEDWLGVSGATMYWSHADRDYYARQFEEIGFEIVWEKFIPEGDSGHQGWLVKRPTGPSFF